MKTTNKINMTAADANTKRLETMRANLAKLESAANEIMVNDPENITSAEKMRLLSFLNISYHDSGKIETIASIDSTSACDFCEKMRNAATNNALIICGFCYAYADKWKEAAWRRHTLNARILSYTIFEKEELETLSIPSALCRINEDGDITCAIHGINILRIIETHKAQSFGVWYKNDAAMAAAFQHEDVTSNEQKSAKYGNARFVQSSVLIGFPAVPRWFSDVVFTVYPDKETTLQAIENGSFECNGRKCKDCKYNCYNANKNGKNVQHVAEFLRTNKAKRAEVIAAYNAKITG